MAAIIFKADMADKDVELAIASIKRRANGLNTDVQMVAVSILAAFKKSGDKPTAAKRANGLVDALGKGMRHNSLLAWFELFAPMVYNKETKALVCASTAASPVKEHGKIDLVAATTSPWYEAMVEPEYKPIADMNAAIATLIKRMETDIEKMGDKSKVDVTKLAALKALSA